MSEHRVLYIETNCFMDVDRYIGITIAYQMAELALKDPDEWERFTSILRAVMEKEVSKNDEGPRNRHNDEHHNQGIQ